MFGRAGRRGLGRNRLHSDHRQRTAPAGRAARPSVARRIGGLERAPRLDGRRRRAGTRSVPRGRARAGTALHHQAHRPRRRGIDPASRRSVRLEDRRRTRPARPPPRPPDAQQPGRMGELSRRRGTSRAARCCVMESAETLRSAFRAGGRGRVGETGRRASSACCSEDERGKDLWPRGDGRAIFSMTIGFC